MPDANRQMIQVFVQGLDGKLRAIDVGAADTGSQLFAQLAASISAPASELLLTCNDKPILDSVRLSDQGVLADSTICVSLRPKGDSPSAPPASNPNDLSRSTETAQESSTQ
jgi:hypothetical protein